MTPNEVAAKLQNFNDWRRGHHDAAIEQPDPRVIGEAIDAAVEMIDRLEAAEAEALEEARLNGMGGEREAALLAKLEAAEKERDECNSRRLEAADHFAAQTALMKEKCDALRAKITEMERQEPVVWMQSSHLSSFKNRLCGSQSAYVHCSDHQLHPYFKPLYALPGAQPAQSVPEGFALVNAARFLAVLDREDWRTAKNRAELRAMLAAEPKPEGNRAP